MIEVFVAGQGSWGKRLKAFLETRGTFSGIADYDNIEMLGYQKNPKRILWVAYPPGFRKTQIILKALRSGFHVIIEKPLMFSREETFQIKREIAASGAQFGVNFQFIYCKQVQRIAQEFASTPDVTFSGKFFAISKNKHQLDARFNLSSHLFAVRRFYFPTSSTGLVECGYGRNDRMFSVYDGKSVKSVDLLSCSCNLLDNYLLDFERSLVSRHSFELSLEFGLQVETDIR